MIVSVSVNRRMTHIAAYSVRIPAGSTAVHRLAFNAHRCTSNCSTDLATL